MFDIEEASIHCLQAAMNKGEVSSRDLTLAYMERISKYDKSGPKLNSVLEINPDALFIADAMDCERSTIGVRGQLHGIPVLLKDNINTRDKMHTSAGSIALSDSYAPYDAYLVGKLRAAGAVILGKANMTEFANFMTEGMPNGYSSRGGQVLNPYNAARDPSGSSSGSAVAVSANLCAAALGTETRGSIMGPAYMNGIVGIKPTVGLVSRSGIIPISNSQDTAGPMARTVEDAAIMLGAIACMDEMDPATWASRDRAYADYTQFLDKDGLQGARIGINEGYIGNFTEDELKVINTAKSVMKENKAVLVYGIGLPNTGGKSSVSLYEFKQSINAYLSSLGPGAPVHSLREIINFNNQHPEEALKYGQKTLMRAELETSGTLSEPAYIMSKINDIRISQTEGIDRVIDENKLDALFCPGITDIAAVAGYPSIMVPAGFTSDGMPFGVTFIGKAYSEPMLLKIAYAFEQAAKARAKPGSIG
ncbi:MAG: amidase family protein [Clostridiaceae bacterium]